MAITKEEYKRNCEYAEALEELQNNCEHPINKRLWYKFKGQLIIACEHCGYNKIVERGD